ncbi:hypothetical protein MPH47_00850 [Psychrobacillus psychrodurans]|uniref:hypothetical protein n=1 Tax=Psychrobacillus psychrodurans TaxID=126157 RepID=UPI001F4D7A29|nr:hypothetical protein [Psychrobacillus psychrodurans]MCK1995780.1 hypothetical protein [Psychrobacillus psychrodurans]
MKKKAIKIAASTAVAASAFVAAAPAQQADAATNVNQLATNAQNAGTVLKWAISVEGSANYETRPYNEYNAAKKAIAAAEAAAKKVSASEQLSIAAKLVEPKLQVKRAQAYIDAITSSEKIKELTADLDAAIKTNDIEKVEKAYHTATAEYRKQAALLDRVYGQSTRDGIRNAVKPTIEKLVASVKNEVTVNMLAKSAAANIKADKLDLASQNIADAQAILDANVLKWETALQKSVDDVATSLPLTISSATYVDANTVQVKLSKKVDAINLSQFYVDGLQVNSVSLADDKKTVTLKTGNQAAGKTYTITFNGKSITYTTPSVGDNSTITVSKDVVHAAVNENVAIQAVFKEKTGQAYTGQIRVTAPTGYTLVSVNGGTPDSATSDLTTPNQNGTVTVVLTSNSSAIAVTGKKVTFEKLFNGSVTEKTESGAINFYTDATAADATTQEVTYVDAKNKYFVVKNATNYVRYTAKTIDAFTNESTNGLSLDQFFAALGKGDEVQVPAYGTTTTSASHFKITFNKVVSDFEFAAKYFVSGVEDTTGAYRVDSNGKFILEGEGHAGYTVYVRPVGGTEYKTTVGSNGKWAVEVNLDKAALTKFEASHVPAGQKADYTTNPVALNVLEGAFAIEDVQISGSTATTLLGKVITFNDTTVTGDDSFVVKPGATITLVDEDGTKIKYTHGVNATFAVTTGNASQATVEITGAYTPVAVGNIAGFGTAFSIDSVTGLANNYGLVAKPVIPVLSK